MLFSLIIDAPIVTLSLGSNLDPKNLAKGTDVYLECVIEANPPIKKIEWYHNVSFYIDFFLKIRSLIHIFSYSSFNKQNKPLQSSRGIIITNQSLVLQSISKQTHGQYMCRANNAQGTVSSNDLYLDIKCKYFPINPLQNIILMSFILLQCYISLWLVHFFGHNLISH